jgi:site-specific DNA-cytosine methylase
MEDKIRTCASRKRGETHKLEMGEDIANSLTTINTDSMVAQPNDKASCIYNGVAYRVRSFTARECFRLMGVDDGDIDKLQSIGLSHTRQVALAGNSIVVDVLAEIFRTLFDEEASENINKPHQLTLF